MRISAHRSPPGSAAKPSADIAGCPLLDGWAGNQACSVDVLLACAISGACERQAGEVPRTGCELAKDVRSRRGDAMLELHFGHSATLQAFG